MRKAACLLTLLAILPQPGAAASLAQRGLAHIGDLQLAFDARRWTVDGAGDRYTITCRARDCFSTVIDVAITGGDAAECTPESVGIGSGRPYPGHVTSLAVASLLLHLSEEDLGCRNLAGGPVRACTTHAGRTYRFEAPGKHCHTMWHASERVAEVLSGLSPR